MARVMGLHMYIPVLRQERLQGDQILSQIEVPLPHPCAASFRAPLQEEYRW